MDSEWTPERLAQLYIDSAFSYLTATPEFLKKRHDCKQVSTISIKDNQIVIKAGYNAKRQWSTEHDVVKVDFWDEKGFLGDTMHEYYVFDVDPATSKPSSCLHQFSNIARKQTRLAESSMLTSAECHIFALLELARKERGPNAVAHFRAADARMLSVKGISAIATPVLRELLISAAYRAVNKDLIPFLALSGPPGTAQETYQIRNWIDVGGETGARPPELPRSVEAALIRGGWCNAETKTWEIDLLTRCCNPEGDEDGAKELFDAHVEVGFFKRGRNTSRALVMFAGAESAVMRQYALERTPLASVPKGHVNRALLSAVRRGAGAVKTMLDIGADPNMVSEGQAALHLAIQVGDEETVKLLLERGAQMVPDGQGQTPLLLAEKMQKERAGNNGSAAIAKPLEDWLEARGLPRDHADVPTPAEG